MNKYIFLYLVLACTSISSAYAWNGSATKVFQQSRPIDLDGQVDIHNKYGKVDIQTWDQPRIEYKITITTVAKNDEAARELLERIHINEQLYGTERIELWTEIEKKAKAWWTWGGSGKEEYTIDYLVRMPSSCALNVDNKYGDVFLDEISGRFELQLKYGDAVLHEINGPSVVNLSYGNGEIVRLHDSEVSMSYGRLQIGDGQDLHLQSKYSKMNLGNCRELDIDSKYDRYQIEKVHTLINRGKYDQWDIQEAGTVDIDTKYTDVIIATLQEGLRANMSYGKARVRNLLEGFHEVDATGRYTSYSVSTPASLQFDLQANYGKIKIPSSCNLIYELYDDHESVKRGGCGSNGGSIHITTHYGNITVD